MEDKLLHFYVSLTLMILLGLFLGITLGVLLTLLLGFFKEIYDRFYGTGFDWLDMLANIIGIGIGLIIITFLRILIIIALI